MELSTVQFGDRLLWAEMKASFKSPEILRCDMTMSSEPVGRPESLFRLATILQADAAFPGDGL